MLQADLLGTALEVLIANSPDVGLSGAVMSSAALQLLPLALTTRVSASDSKERLAILGGRLVRLTCRVAASLH